MAVGDRRPQAPLIRKIRRLAQFQAVKKPIGERERVEALSRFYRSRRQGENPAGFQTDRF